MAPFGGLRFDLNRIRLYDYVDQAAGLITLVSALDGVVRPFTTDEFAWLKLRIPLGPIIRLLNASAGVKAIYEIRETRDYIPATSLSISRSTVFSLSDRNSNFSGRRAIRRRTSWEKGSV